MGSEVLTDILSAHHTISPPQWEEIVWQAKTISSWELNLQWVVQWLQFAEKPFQCSLGGMHAHTSTNVNNSETNLCQFVLDGQKLINLLQLECKIDLDQSECKFLQAVAKWRHKLPQVSNLLEKYI